LPKALRIVLRALIWEASATSRLECDERRRRCDVRRARECDLPEDVWPLFHGSCGSWLGWRELDREKCGEDEGGGQAHESRRVRREGQSIDNGQTDEENVRA
jgi:hypothetical protein